MQKPLEAALYQWNNKTNNTPLMKPLRNHKILRIHQQTPIFCPRYQHQGKRVRYSAVARYRSKQVQETPVPFPRPKNQPREQGGNEGNHVFPTRQGQGENETTQGRTTIFLETHRNPVLYNYDTHLDTPYPRCPTRGYFSGSHPVNTRG